VLRPAKQRMTESALLPPDAPIAHCFQRTAKQPHETTLETEMTVTTWSNRLRLLAVPLLICTLAADVLADDLANPLEPKPIHSFRHLKRLLQNKSIHTNPNYRLKAEATENGLAVFSDSDGLEHSETNVQVAGVDEGDKVKTDGRFIYRIHDGQIQIVRARPATNMAVAATLHPGGGFYPMEIYVHNRLLVVIGTGWFDAAASGSIPVKQTNGGAKLAIWAPSGESRTLAKVYDISKPDEPALKREIAFSGDYLSSRRIGNIVYLVGRKYPHYFMYGLVDQSAWRKQKPRMTRANLLPRIVDSAVNDGSERSLPIRDLYFFPDFVEPDYVVVAGFRLDALDERASIKAFLGSGDIVYASKDNLYLSAADYNYNSNPTDGETVSAPTTHVYKFALADGTVDFTRAGEIPGTVLNSYAMDEHKGFFRIATTTDQWTQSGDNSSFKTWNNLYTLDQDMNIAGRLEHLAEGERISAARFMGDRGYLVTFQQTDPLFVIDLATPQSPRVLGELKIPGFSNYLHPYDDTHLLSFGQDTQETADGVVTTGMKLALFDVTDVARPSQMHSLTLGAQGSYSPVQWDPKALLFNKKTGLLGFPISITQQQEGADWPTGIFQGALVYQVSLDQGFNQLAKITHKRGGFDYDWHYYIGRLLTIGRQLYTLSPARIQANSLSDFSLTGGLDIPIAPVIDGCTAPVGDDTAAVLFPIDCPIVIDLIDQPNLITERTK